MKKILHILVLLCITTTVSFAQQQSREAARLDLEKSEKMQTIKSCPELNAQLTKLFGEKFDPTDKKVVAQLKSNIKDNNACACIRKNSLFLVYGEDYINHKNEIDQVNK